jgi:uroporphyrinogen-III synthase
VSSRPLADCGVLVTRPAHQAGRLCALIEAAGGVPVPFPVIEIHSPVNLAPARALIRQLGRYQIALFVSANAVEFGLRLVAEAGGEGLPPSLRVGAVGRATAAALRARGIGVDLAPTARFDSEGLLALEPLRRVEGQRVLIFRGEGGRELLTQTLRDHGAEVDHAEVYRRAPPSADPAPLLAAWREGRVDVITLTSVEALENLRDLVGARGLGLLRGTPLVTLSARVAARAESLGLSQRPRVATEASDRGLLEALVAWRREQVQAAP